MYVKWKMKNSFELIGNSYKFMRIDCNWFYFEDVHTYNIYIDNVKHERNVFYEPFDVVLFVEDVVLSVDGVFLKEMHFT